MTVLVRGHHLKREQLPLALPLDHLACVTGVIGWRWEHVGPDELRPAARQKLVRIQVFDGGQYALDARFYQQAAAMVGLIQPAADKN